MAVKNGHRYVAETLLKHGSQIDARNHFQETPLHLAAKNGRRYVAEILLKQGSQVDARNRFQETPLHLAAKNGHQQTAELLIHHGSDVNARNKLKESPLHLAAENGHPHITQFVIERGGLVNARNDSNDSFNGVNTNAFAVPATFLWFEALCTVSVMTLVLLSWWNCHRREHCLRRFSTLPLRESSSQPKTKELLQPVSHDKQAKESTVSGALHEGCAAMSRRSTPPICNDLGMLIQQEHIEVKRAARMERVRTWLECIYDQEEMSSLGSEGNYVVTNPALATG